MMDPFHQQQQPFVSTPTAPPMQPHPQQQQQQQQLAGFDQTGAEFLEMLHSDGPANPAFFDEEMQ